MKPTPSGRLSQLHLVATILAPFSSHAPFVTHHVHYRCLSSECEKVLGFSEKRCNISVQGGTGDRE